MKGPLRLSLRHGTTECWVGQREGTAWSERLRPFVKDRRIVLVTDATVDPLWGSSWREALEGAAPEWIRTELVPSGEGCKELSCLEKLWKRCLAHGLRRSDCIVALGGGALCDLSAFAASTYMRGCDLILLPSTVIAQVDAALGGKTAIDLPEGKNLVGSFHPARLVLADTALLETLSPRDRSSGLVEAVKLGLLNDPAFIPEVMAAWELGDWPFIVQGALTRKASFCHEDEGDRGIRRQLNLGHSLGHALEAAQGYEGLRHGEAVALGTLWVMLLARELGRCEIQAFECLRGFYARIGVALDLPALDWPTLHGHMLHDKKSTGRGLQLVVPDGEGKVEVMDAPSERVMEKAWNDLGRWLGDA